MKRRTFLGVVSGALAAPAIIGLRRKTDRPLAGGFADDGGTRGHRLRDRQALPSRLARRLPVVIIGGGIAGLSAAWELDRRSMRDYVLLELESDAGGNSRWGENEITAFPWAAHYVPVPAERDTMVRELFMDLGVLRDGVWDERHLCFAPHERLYQHAEWISGVEPTDVLDARGRAAFEKFGALIDAQRATGEFTIPMERGARAGSPLDGMNMREWMKANGLDHAALRWYVDYACRDDYGARAGDVSAWAGVHYFASREETARGPLTWPEGNGWIARRLIERAGARVRTDTPALRIERTGTRWTVHTLRESWLCDAVIFAAPGFTLPFLLEGAQPDVSAQYSPWLTANLVIDRWPRERGRGAPPAWDNVIYDSPSLGYVVATHQGLRTVSEPTIWTYYWALADASPSAGRALLRDMPWSYWSEQILADLQRAHPDIRECVSRMDIMRMGHAMIRPVPGFLTATRARLARAPDRLFLANSDAGGLPLFEEAHVRGVEAARRAIAAVA